jgi:fatty acid desaturase
MVQLAIDGEWYDLEKWALTHPGGKQILTHYQDADATEAFYSLHSEKAVKMLKLMRPMERKEVPPVSSDFDKAFGEFRTKLKAEGWYDREPFEEARLLILVLGMFIWGTVYSYTYPITAAMVIGVGMQQAGWLSHDMVHSKDSGWCAFLSNWLPGFLNGFDKTWWSRKHNTHHVMTNHLGVDPDIDLMPVFFLYAPTKACDSHLRKYQHLYAIPMYSLLYVLWRAQSMSRAIALRDYETLVYKMLPGYIWLGCLPVIVSFGSVMFGGLLVAMVVVQSHEDEEMTEGPAQKCGFAMTQFNATSDIICWDPITEYLFGGMQYQLTHHLMPMVPRYKYAALQPVVEAWCAEQGVVYKKDGVVAMTVKHFAMLRRNGLTAQVETTIEGGWGDTASALQPECVHA